MLKILRKVGALHLVKEFTEVLCFWILLRSQNGFAFLIFGSGSLLVKGTTSFKSQTSENNGSQSTSIFNKFSNLNIMSISIGLSIFSEALCLLKSFSNSDL